ncbi:NAD-dependent dehydratase [Microbacterium sp. CH12i]|uniref:hypothetical protein n=1 Tax=Microbacterium sp. CH12i TaxID=1479651 RepID=UPI000461B643|nr:hypothetical protein [Microbacterium sp. CH12i]KDA04865.1 NAD-dependent dehydratase [Microbacterium sp. CH12i]
MSKTALVIGGTGPSGPKIVRGLLERGYDVTILHGGQHENGAIPPEVQHIHADPHFAETLLPAVEGRHDDLVLAQYGRLKTIVDVVSGRTPRLIAIGGATGLAASTADPGWGPIGKPALLTEHRILPEHDIEKNKIAYRMVEAQNHLFSAHRHGAFSATYLGYPPLYGPNQLAPQDWTVVRRALDGRATLVLPDGGLRLETRAYSQNVANAVLLAADKPEESAGKRYIVTDPHTYTMRQRVEYIASLLGHTFEIIDLPWELARPAHPLYRHIRDHSLTDSMLIRAELGYTDEFAPADAVKSTVEWLLENRPEPGGAVENQIGDPFDYDAEDRLVHVARGALGTIAETPFELPAAAHQYRHPKKPGEKWARQGAEKK